MKLASQELRLCKISHICRCNFKCQVSVTGKTRSSFPLRRISGFCLNGGEQLNDVIANKLNILYFSALKLVIKLNVKLCNCPEINHKCNASMVHKYTGVDDSLVIRQ